MNTSSTPPHAACTLAENLGTKIALTKEQIHAAKSRIEVAQQGVEDCTARSTFDGIVITKDTQDEIVQF
jgi:hypothetical protein